MLSTVKDIELKNKAVFIRVDFNVPVKDGTVQDDTRIVEALQTIRYVQEKGGRPVLGSHFGRPKGEKNLKYSLRSVVDHINKEKYFKAQLLNDCVGDEVQTAIRTQQADVVLILENLRFYPGEESNDPAFVNALAAPFDAYVNDAFGVSHRKHASVYGMPLVMANKGAGFLIEKEVKYFDKIVHSPEKPFAAILGGAKVSDKIGVINSLLDKADCVFIGGAMAYTFLQCLGHTTGTSLVEESQLSVVDHILTKAEASGSLLYLPVDHIVSSEFGGTPEICETVDIPPGKMGLDIGKNTVTAYQSALAGCKTVLWNGPMGVFEEPAYANGTFQIARFLADMDATVIVGGGDSVSAVKQAGVANKISHISTGGGASLEYVEYGTLPGIEVLRK